MDIEVVGALLLGLYGAGLSTYLALRERKKERKQIRIFLEHVKDELAKEGEKESAQITIVNVGHRPTTIVDMSLEIFSTALDREGPVGQMIAPNLLKSTEGVSFFPVTLEDGEPMTIPLGTGSDGLFIVTEKIPTMLVKIRVYDVEGNIYTDYTRRTYNKTFGYFRPSVPEPKLSE